MIREVVWTAEARADALSIARHIAVHDPDAAERVTTRIFDAGNLLGQGVPGRKGRMADTFEKVVRGLPYILAYDILPSATEIERIVVLHVIHGARDWSSERWPDD